MSEKRKRIVVLAAILVCGIDLSATENVVRDLSEILEPIRVEHDLPALAAALVVDGAVVGSGAVGVRKLGSEASVTIDDQWHLGSCTKAMTATMIGKLVEEGRLSWSTTVAAAFPDMIDEILPDWHEVTLMQLLTHRSGLPEDRVPDALFFKLRGLEGPMMEQRRELVRLALARKPVSEPGTTMAYSNLGYSIAGAMAEAACGKAWEDLMAEVIFEPLGMTTAGFGPPEEGEPRGHMGTVPFEPGPLSDNPPVIGPAGTVHASIGDWARFVSVHLAGARGESDFLKAETFASLHTPPRGESYAPGWVIAEREWAGGRVLTHSGSNGLWFAVVWVAPERNMAVVVTSNLGPQKAAAGTDAAASALIRIFENPDGDR